MVVLTAKLVSAFLYATLVAGQTHNIGRKAEHVPSVTQENIIKRPEFKHQVKTENHYVKAEVMQ